MKYIIHPSKAAVSAVITVICLTLTVILFAYQSWLVACMFSLLAMVYGYILCVMGGTVNIDREGVKQTQRFRRTRAMQWNQIREVGVIGIRVVNHENTHKTGPKYIYFSDEILSENERFDLGLNWPPKRKVYLRFSYDRIRMVQRFWKGDFVLYNAGGLYLNGSQSRKAEGTGDDVLS